MKIGLIRPQLYPHFKTEKGITLRIKVLKHIIIMEGMLAVAKRRLKNEIRRIKRRYIVIEI
jgi:hypothetical protein